MNVMFGDLLGLLGKFLEVVGILCYRGSVFCLRLSVFGKTQKPSGTSCVVNLGKFT